MQHTHRLLVALLPALLLTTACGSGDTLDGSIGDTFSLDFDSVDIKKQDEYLLVEYRKGADRVCKVLVDTTDLGLKDGSKVSGEDFLDSVQISRVDASGQNFPDVDSGELELDDYEFKKGGKVSGEFSVVFENGRTLDGEFSGDVEEVAID